MDELYESKISVKRWIVYDILGNAGWIAYFVCVWMLLRRGVTLFAVLSVLPAVLMLVGLVELISERIAKLSYVLPKVRLYRGFGALTLGGVCGVVVAAAALCVGGGPVGLLGWMLGGSVLLTVFAGLLLREYHPMKTGK